MGDSVSCRPTSLGLWGTQCRVHHWPTPQAQLRGNYSQRPQAPFPHFTCSSQHPVGEPGCAGSWQTGRMGERGGSQSGSPPARQQSANEKRAVERNTAQRHLCQRHQQEMRLQHHVIVRRLSRQGTELRHVLSELTKQQSMIRHDDGRDDPDTAGEDEERGGQGASEGTEPVINPYPVTFPSGAGHKKLCRQSAVGETSQVMYNSHVKLRRQPSVPRHTAAPGLHHPRVLSQLTRHRQTSPRSSPTRHQYTRSASPVKDWVQQHATRMHLTATSGTSGSPSAVLRRPERYNPPGTTARSTLATDTSHGKPPTATVDTQPAAASSRRHSCAGLPQVSAKEATAGRSVPALQPGSRSRSDNALNRHTAVGNTHPSTTSAPVHGGQSSTQPDPLHQRRSTTPAGAGRTRSCHRHSLQSLLPGGQPTQQTRGRRASRRYSLQETFSTISINGDQC